MPHLQTAHDNGGHTRETTLSERDRVSELLQNAGDALDLSMALAPLIPIPIISSIVSSASVIVEALKVNMSLRLLIIIKSHYHPESATGPTRFS